MKTHALLAALSAGMLSVAARAASQPIYAPPGSWVRPVPAGNTTPVETGRPRQMNWRETEALDKPAVTTGKDGTELVIDMHDADPPATTEGALRFPGGGYRPAPAD